MVSLSFLQSKETKSERLTDLAQKEIKTRYLDDFHVIGSPMDPGLKIGELE